MFAPVGHVIPKALQSVRKGGTVISAGIYMTPIPEMDYTECFFHEKDLRSTECNTREDGRELLELAALIPIKPLIEAFPLKDANRALNNLKHHAVKGTAVLIME